MKFNKTIIKSIILVILGIVGIVIGFAVDPTTIPINVLWGIFLATMYIISICVVLLFEAIIR